MSIKRVPLGNVPNAANSPFRAVTATTSKRSRDQVEQQEDLYLDAQPRPKRQAVDISREKLRTPPIKQSLQTVEGRVFNGRLVHIQPNAFQRRLLAARESRPQQRVERQDRAHNETLDTVRQWQRYYRKSFPQFVFYFESVPEETRVRYSKFVRQLGAKEEKFFSKEVTHVVTTRPYAANSDSKDATDPSIPSSMSAGSQPSSLPRTINPSLLNQPQYFHGQPPQSRSKFTFEAPSIKRAALNGIHDTEPRKGNGGNADILLKAEQMGMKIWQMEKLQRILSSMTSVPNEIQPQDGNNTRPKVTNNLGRGEQAVDLSRMLRDERLHGPSDRDASTALNEQVPFKGCYIYIRDMDERSKPIMVRDYPKPTQDEDGEWPQFHGNGVGKCAFVPEQDVAARRELQKVKAREEEERAKAKAETQLPPRTRAAVIRQDAEIECTRQAPKRQPLEEARGAANAPREPDVKIPTQSFCPPPPAAKPSTGNPLMRMKDAGAQPGPKLFGGEPAASGMQPSNITSAIRSQMISSTAAQPGAKAGTSKEVHGLKRKVLEKNSGPALNQMQTRQRSLDPTGNGRAEKTIPQHRWTRKPTQEPMIHIDEESTQSEEDKDVWLAEESRLRKESKGSSTPAEKKDPKPGYCENCREKYDDFDDHIVGRKHRRFALTAENWKDLDRLLVHLGRRRKEPDSDGF